MTKQVTNEIPALIFVPVGGYFGAQTEIGVKKFQKANDLPVDGKVGALTLSMIEAQ